MKNEPTYTINDSFMHFAEVELNGKVITADNMLLDNGSTGCRRGVKREYSRFVNLYEGSCSYHAEQNLIYKILRELSLGRLKESKLSGLSITVIRVKKDGTFGNSKPCSNCMPMLMDCPFISEVYWSTDDMDNPFDSCKL